MKKTIRTRYCGHCLNDLPGQIQHVICRLDGIFVPLCQSCWDYRQANGKLPEISIRVFHPIPGRRDEPVTLDLLDQLQDGDLHRFRWASFYKRVLRDG